MDDVELFLVMLLAIIVLLLVLSSFFSGAETALTAVSRPLMHQRELSGDIRARLVNRLRRDKERLLGSILIGNNLVNILASVLATYVLTEIFGEAGLVYATLAMTAIVVVFAEVLPKTYAITHADRMALAVAPILRLFVILFTPLSRAVQWIVRGILGLMGVHLSHGTGTAYAEEELRGAIALHSGDDQDSRHERIMLHSILDLDDVEVGNVMIHRSNMVTLDAALPPAEIVREVVASPYTRIPIWRDKPDNIVGVLHAKSLLKAVEEHPGDHKNLDIVGLAAEPWFIPETTDLLAQLQAFRRRGEHFALVVDEYGDLMGIVTLEDILEEIVGDISDETDVPRRGIRPQPNGTVIADGDVTLRDLNRRFDWNLPDEDAATIAGLVLHESRLIPEQGQIFTFHNFRFEVLGRKGNRLTAICVTPPKPLAQH
jgi:Mg2+/Co2+ transporter CorB